MESIDVDNSYYFIAGPAGPENQAQTEGQWRNLLRLKASAFLRGTVTRPAKLAQSASIGVTLSVFCSGDRVRVSDDFFWAKGAKGTISVPPDAVTNLSGAWDRGLTRQETSALGTHIVYWVWFDEPQFDADGDGPYSGGQVWESALILLTDRPN